MEADTDKHTKVQMELELRCIADCTDGTALTALTPELESELAMWLWEMHVAAHHHHHPPAAPPAPPSYTPRTDSVKLLAVPSIAAEDTFGLFTKSMAKGIRIKSPSLPTRRTSPSQVTWPGAPTRLPRKLGRGPPSTGPRSCCLPILSHI